MGIIFGISDLPVTTFTTPFEQPKIVAPRAYYLKSLTYEPKNVVLQKKPSLLSYLLDR